MTRFGHCRGAFAGAGIAAALLVAGCNTEPKVGPPASLTQTGNGQTANAGTAVAVAPAVTIKDAAGKGVPNIAVTFTAGTVGSTVVGGAATTDANGTATVTSWTLGTVVGTNTLVATAADVPGSPATFTATGTAGAPALVTKVSVDPAGAPAGGFIDSIVVRVGDQFNNPVAGAAVTFAVTAGGGSVSPTTQTTSANGLAGARWTIGATIGVVNTATATVAGLPPVTFSTTSVKPVAGMKFPASVLIVDSLGTITPAVTAVDQSGAPVAGATYTLTTRNASIATIGSNNISITGVRTGQTFVIATATDNSNAIDSALVIVAAVGGPVVTLTVPRFDLKADTTFTLGVVVDMRASGEKLGATTLQVTWDPNILTYVSNAEGSSAVGATLNTSGAPTGSLTMAMASSAGFAGAVEVRQITFKASAAGRTGLPLVVAAIDLSAAGTLTNLLPKTVSGTFPLRTR